ncbi:hypothetical protein KKA00_11925 [bacterium]|nr:hypothetical protein [bacterium]MBU1652923.1 hypothetical protein [bacterium]MBU1880458.1 hypothetical protein [bacterium]
MKKMIPIAFAIMALVLFGCTDMGDPVTAPDNGGTNGIDFSSQILPIFQASCAVCHSGAALNGGLDLSSYASLIAGTSNHGPVVIANDAANSYLIWAVEGTNGAVPMPVGGTLSQTNIGLIKQWIGEGALESAPGGGNNGGSGEVTFSENILPVLQSCVPCHIPPDPVDGLDFSSYEVLMDETAHDPVIEPFDPEGSDLYRKIIEDNENDRMPPLPFASLAQATIDNIYQWIADGALNN